MNEEAWCSSAEGGAGPGPESRWVLARGAEERDVWLMLRRRGREREGRRCGSGGGGRCRVANGGGEGGEEGRRSGEEVEASGLGGVVDGLKVRRDMVSRYFVRGEGGCKRGDGVVEL